MSLALPLLLVRRLAQSEFGSYKQAFLVIGSAISILPLGFGLSTYYFLPREDNPSTRNQVIFNVILFNLVVGLLAFLFLLVRPDLFSYLFHDTRLAGAEVLVGAVILFWVFSSFLETIAVANQEAKLATIFILGTQLSKAIFLLMAAVFVGTVYSLIVAALIHSVLQTVILITYLSLRFRGFWFSFSWSMLRKQMSYAIPYGATALLFAIQSDLHNYFVANRFNSATFAIYSIGCLQVPFVGILTESFASGMIPRISVLQKEGNGREIVRLMARVMRQLAAVLFPVYAFLMVCGREFIRWLFTDAYDKSWPIFAVNLTLIPFWVIMLDPIIRAYAEQRYFLVRLRLVLLVVLTAGLWFAVQKFGPLGVIVVVVSVTLLEHLIVTYRSAKLIGVQKSDVSLLHDVGKLAVATLLAATVGVVTRAFLSGFRPFHVLMITGVVFVLFYVGTVLLLKVPTSTELQLLRKKVSGFERLLFWRGNTRRFSPIPATVAAGDGRHQTTPPEFKTP